MSAVVLRRSGKRQFIGIDERNQTLVVDAGPKGGGQFAGLKPSELLPFSVGACIGVTVLNILEKQRQGPFGLEIEIGFAQKAEAPWPFTRISLHYKFEGANLDRTRIEKSLQMAEEKYCAVSASLRDDVRIESTITISEPQPPTG